MREVLARVDTSSYVEPSIRTLGDYLTDEWLPTQAPQRVSPNRYRNIRNAVERHLVPHLGRVGLQNLNAAHLDRFYGVLLRGGPVPGRDEARRPLAPATMVQIHGVIRKALRDALKWGLVEQNVATLAEPPSNASVQAARRQAIRIWTPEELTRFLDRTRKHWLHPMWVLATTPDCVAASWPGSSTTASTSTVAGWSWTGSWFPKNSSTNLARPCPCTNPS